MSTMRNNTTPMSNASYIKEAFYKTGPGWFAAVAKKCNDDKDEYKEQMQKAAMMIPRCNTIGRVYMHQDYFRRLQTTDAPQEQQQLSYYKSNVAEQEEDQEEEDEEEDYLRKRASDDEDDGCHFYNQSFNCSRTINWSLYDEESSIPSLESDDDDSDDDSTGCQQPRKRQRCSKESYYFITTNDAEPKE